MPVVSDTYALLTGLLAGNEKHVEMYSYSGGKRRYATIEERQAAGPITVTIFGNQIIRSEPESLMLDSHGHTEGSTREAFLNLTAIRSLGVGTFPGRWTVGYDTGYRLWPVNGQLNIDHSERWVAVQHLQPGDKVDLADDLIASVPCTPDCDSCASRIMHYEYEYQIVDEVDQETPESVRVDWCDGESHGFSTNHMLRVHGRGPISVTREHMQGAPEVEVDTPFGPLLLKATSADGIMVDCRGDDRFITVNKTRVAFLHHWWLQPDGSWSDIGDANHSTRLSINRKDFKNYNNRDATLTCYRKVRETIPTVVREWAESPIGKHWLAYAHEAHVNNRAKHLEEKIAEQEAAVRTTKDELAFLLHKDVSEIEEALRG